MLSLEKQNAYRERYRQMRPGWQPSGERYEATVRQYVTPATRLLDLGCGRGGLIEKLGPEVAAPVGIDPDWSSLAEHRSPLTWRTCAWADALPFKDGCFDVVMASWLLEHLADPLHVLSEVARVLTPGGHFVTLTPNAWHPLLVANRISRIAPAVQRALVPRLYGRSEADTFRVYYRANAPRTVQQLARQVGLAVANCEAIADPTYLAFTPLTFALAARAEAWLPEALRVHLVIDVYKPH